VEIGNQYSYVLIAAGVALGVGLLLRLLRIRWIGVGSVALLIVVLFSVGWLLLRPGTSDVESLDAADTLLSNGNPTFVEFFSNYCAGCISVRPAVDNLVAELRNRYGDQYNVLRVDIHTTFGRELRERYGFSYTPEFVLFDGSGTEIWRNHVPPTETEIDLALPVESSNTSP
jgi:thiol-disulfide isomerase/thioredoxin